MGAQGFSGVGSPPNSSIGSFNLSTPAGWAMIWWGLSIVIILAILWSL